MAHMHLYYQEYENDKLNTKKYAVTEVDSYSSAKNLLDMIEGDFIRSGHQLDRATPTLLILTGGASSQRLFQFSIYPEVGHTCADYKSDLDKWLMGVFNNDK